MITWILFAKRSITCIFWTMTCVFYIEHFLLLFGRKQLTSSPTSPSPAKHDLMETSFEIIDNIIMHSNTRSISHKKSIVYSNTSHRKKSLKPPYLSSKGNCFLHQNHGKFESSNTLHPEKLMRIFLRRNTIKSSFTRIKMLIFQTLFFYFKARKHLNKALESMAKVADTAQLLYIYEWHWKIQWVKWVNNVNTNFYNSKVWRVWVGAFLFISCLDWNSWFFSVLPFWIIDSWHIPR